ncbi:YtxH domain-containing protein [Priestia flexa]|uniref:YtxH domain-containing protein n=1 Tax=Priestia flexa TaxID=86664 RepID=UPI000C237586|nr:YtxH domain-containing protein [Priestia flexa]MEC0667618.1 YtxH domain-containing protein [Priestia flexa]
MKRTTSLFTGIAAGSIAAAAATLLLTPTSGKTLRQRIAKESHQVKETKEDISGKIKHLKTQIQTTAKDGNTIVKNIAKDLSKTLNEFQKDIRPHQQSIQSHLNEIEDSLSHLEKHIQTTKTEGK